MDSLNEFTDELIIVYGMDGHQINVDTLTGSITSFTNALYRINSILYPDHEVEFVIESFQTGSFKAIIKKLRHAAGNEFIIPLFAHLIFLSGEKLAEGGLQSHKDPYATEISADGQWVVFHDRGKTFVLPKDLIENYNQVRKDSQTNGLLREGYDAVKKDNKVNYLEFLPKASEKDGIKTNREDFDKIIGGREQNSESVTHDQTPLEIIQTSHERNNPKWDFYWKGQKISATIEDQGFIINYFHRRIIKNGDFILVKLIENKKNDFYTDSLMHSTFRIIEVYEDFEN
jgi:hypothetical protein